MKRVLLLTPIATAVVLLCGLAGAENKQAEEARIAKIERGRHIVDGVSMCNDCHTPILENGQLDEANRLMGAVLPFRPSGDVPWAEIAPQIVGLPAMTDDEAIHFFMVGERPGGVPPRPPMPRYRMSRDEAESVVAYLRSLAPKA